MPRGCQGRTVTMNSIRFMFAAKDGKLAGAVVQSKQGGDERRQEPKTIRVYFTAKILGGSCLICLSRHYPGHSIFP
jgi:hypothetical protein